MSKTDFRITKRDDLKPICPFCEKELEDIYVKTKGLGWLEGKTAPIV